MSDSLFDEPEESTWQEVPQPRFLSWSPAMQYRYCAERDRDAAEHSDDYNEAMWFIERAKSYDALAEELK
jgi:hypothetical protein